MGVDSIRCWERVQGGLVRGYQDWLGVRCSSISCKLFRVCSFDAIVQCTAFIAQATVAVVLLVHEVANAPDLLLYKISL